MIESISIADVATYGATPQTLTDLKEINYIFGSNGAGKSTIGRIIEDDEQFSNCTVQWRRGKRLQTLIYNQQFVERNFLQSTELKGVFTLGEHEVDNLKKIAAAKKELDQVNNTLTTLTLQLKGLNGKEGKQGELEKLRAKFQDKSWQQKIRLTGMLTQKALKGSMGSKASFCEKLLEEGRRERGLARTLEDLEIKAESLFGAMPLEATVFTVDLVSLLALEPNPLLAKPIFGKETVDIAAMIQKLENSDWVREGRVYFEKNDDVCPFCQQTTSPDFAKSLGEYFDETFLSDINLLNNLITTYNSKVFLLQKDLSSVIDADSPFVDTASLKKEKDLLDAKIVINRQRLSEKQKEVSRIIQLDSLESNVRQIRELIDSANDQIRSHNQMVANVFAEREKFKTEVWTYILGELGEDLKEFLREEEKLERAVSALVKRIDEVTLERTQKEREIGELEMQSTSIEPTIDAINKLLLAYGFQGFKVAQAEGNRTYKLVRANGTDAMATLSEGEKTFVTFLYFYQLLKGSASATGVTTDRVVVFDDPVSSLDSNVLFIVSSLIRALFEEIRKNDGLIKQVFVLTHNVYFHKEITYCSKRDGDKRLSDESFWMVRKPTTVSGLEFYESNPIKTSYHLLWSEVRDRRPSNFGIQNNLRRILEYYFKILGGVNFEGLIDKFTGSDKITCKSLVSWVHDGSHFSLDDLYVSLDEASVENHLRIFRMIFEKTNNLGHYKMMMGSDFEEEPPAIPAAPVSS